MKNINDANKILIDNTLLIPFVTVFWSKYLSISLYIAPFSFKYPALKNIYKLTKYKLV